MKKLFAKMEWILWLITLAPSFLLYWFWEKIPQTIATHYTVFLICRLFIIFVPVIYSFWLFISGKTAQ